MAFVTDTNFYDFYSFTNSKMDTSENLVEQFEMAFQVNLCLPISPRTIMQPRRVSYFYLILTKYLYYRPFVWLTTYVRTGISCLHDDMLSLNYPCKANNNATSNDSN